MRIPVESYVILVLLTVKVVDFIPKLRAVHSQLFENVVLFPCRREAEEIAALHPFLHPYPAGPLILFRVLSCKGPLTPQLKSGACARPVMVMSLFPAKSVGIDSEKAFRGND